MRNHAYGREKGFTLTEALVSFGVTAVGLLAVASFQGDLFSESAYNKARTEALALAQEKIEQFRHYTHSDEDNYLDDNDDGVMDADGTYAEDPVTGQNAVFTRSWVLSTTGQAAEIDVSVSWTDSSNVPQSVLLEATVPFISPRGGADAIAGFNSPLLNSPTGRAEIGDGELGDYDSPTLYAAPDPGGDGLSIYQAEEDLLLVDDQNKVLLTLKDACNTETQQCTDFVKISGTVYLDLDASNVSVLDIYIIASNSAHCERWVANGTLSNPPTTRTRDYQYFNYTCYIGGGWHGNIGVVTAPDSIQQTDKVCQGDPTAASAYDQPVIALRRAYRGMLTKTAGGTTIYQSHGIKDATVLNGHDFVFTRLAVSETQGIYCWGFDAPMTRTDSENGTLFSGVPTDFFCLNQDANADSSPDYLDAYNTNEYTAATFCPYDPTNPPVTTHKISGVISVFTADAADLSKINIVTSDGPNNCKLLTDFRLGELLGLYSAGYSCDVYNWGSGWTGYVELEPNTYQLYCPAFQVDFTDVGANQSQAFFCQSSNTIVVEGSYGVDARSESAGLTIGNPDTLTTGYCDVNANDFRCLLPYEGDGPVNVKLQVLTLDTVCDAPDRAFLFESVSVDYNPLSQDVWVVPRTNVCP